MAKKTIDVDKMTPTELEAEARRLAAAAKTKRRHEEAERMKARQEKLAEIGSLVVTTFELNHDADDLVDQVKAAWTRQMNDAEFARRVTEVYADNVQADQGMVLSTLLSVITRDDLSSVIHQYVDQTLRTSSRQDDAESMDTNE